MVKNPHPIQMKILKKLLFSQSLRYLELKPAEIENNQFDFHLDQTIKDEFIQKSGNQYLLTQIGKEFANRMDTDKVQIAKQAKISIVVFPTKMIKGTLHYLIYTRLKQPFYNCQGFLSGKVMYGEQVLDSAKRELKEETNLDSKVKIVCIKHYLVFDKLSKELVEDKFMFFCLAKNPKGKLVSGDEGKYEWVPDNNIFSYVTNHFVSNEEFKSNVAQIKNFTGSITFEEITQITEKF